MFFLSGFFFMAIGLFENPERIVPHFVVWK